MNQESTAIATADPQPAATPALQTPNQARKANSARSTGPRSAAGKARSRCNAARHYLSGRTIMGSADELKNHRTLARVLIDDLQPVGALETTLVHSLADAQFQLDRARAAEQNLLFESAVRRTDEADSTRDFQRDYAHGLAETFEQKGKQLDLMGRYANRFHRQIIQIQDAFYKARKERQDQQDREALAEIHRQQAETQRLLVEQQREQLAVEAHLRQTYGADVKRLEERQEAKKRESSFVSQPGAASSSPLAQATTERLKEAQERWIAASKEQKVAVLAKLQEQIQSR